MFELSPTLDLRFVRLGTSVVLVADECLIEPDRVRSAALALRFAPPAEALYPGGTADIPGGESLSRFKAKLLDIVNLYYLPRLGLKRGGDAVEQMVRVEPDFAIVDSVPGELEPLQRAPHVDPVPIFGLIYLNRAERGGTLFFERSETGGEADPQTLPATYASEVTPGWKQIGRIEGRYNRLAIYPGFIPHSDEIAGEWIHTDARKSEPRLTMRLPFLET